MKHLRFSPFVFVVVLSILLAACSGGATLPNNSNPTIAPFPTVPRLPSVAPFPTVAPLPAVATSTTSNTGAGQILFQDDFSNPNSGWIDANLDSIQFAYANGARRIVVKSGGINSHDLLPDKTFGDVSLEADVQFVSGPTDTSIYGLVCRGTADTVLQSGYEFLITAHGGYGILKVSGPAAGQSAVLGKEGTSSAIKTGNATNHLRADCAGDTLTFFVNGQQIESVSDSDFAKGQVGFALSSQSGNPGYEVDFDNFVVRATVP